MTDETKERVATIFDWVSKLSNVLISAGVIGGAAFLWDLQGTLATMQADLSYMRQNYTQQSQKLDVAIQTQTVNSSRLSAIEAKLEILQKN